MQNYLLNQDYAHRCIDCNTYKGALTNFSCPEVVCSTTGTVLHLEMECCQGWDSYITHAATCGLYLVAGQGAVQVMPSLCHTSSLPFTLPCPATPSVQTEVTDRNNIRYVSYVVTEKQEFFGRVFNSPVSLPSPEVELGVVTIKTNSSRPCNLYRLEATYTDGRVAGTQPNYMTYLIAENVMGQHVDRPDARLSIPSEYLMLTRNPPQDLQWIGRTSSGVLVGVSFNRFYFTLPDQPFVWVGEYSLEQHRPLWLEIRGDDAVLFTDKDVPIYTLRLNPDQIMFERRELLTDQTLASIGSVSQGNAGIVYASHHGLMLLSGVPYGRNSLPSVKALPSFTGFDYKSLNPASIRGSIFGQFYIFTSDVASYLIDFGDDIIPLSESMSLTELKLNDTIQNATAFTHDGQWVYWSQQGSIYRWNPYHMPAKRIDQERTLDLNCCPFYYESSIMEGWFSAGLVESISDQSLTLTVSKVNGCKTQHIRTLTLPCKSFRLPACTTKSHFFYSISGCGTVREIRLNTSLTALTQEAANPTGN